MAATAFHDLIREHARALAADDPADGATATGRLLDYYLHTALAASRHVAARLRGGRRAPPLLPAARLRAPAAAAQQATAWLAAERGNLQAATESRRRRVPPARERSRPRSSSFLYAGASGTRRSPLHQTGAAPQPGRPVTGTAEADALDHLASSRR